MCPMQYFSEYVLGWRGPANIKADKGTIVHKVLEIVAMAKLAHQNGEVTIVEDGIGEWDVYGDTVLDNEQIDQITQQVFDWYSSHHDQHNWTSKDYNDCHKWVMKALEFNGGEYDPRNKDIVAPEASFDFTIDEPWAHFKYELEDETIEGYLAMKGTIDQVNRIDDKTYEILDWKTGRRLDWATGEEKTHKKLQTDPQLRMYHYAAHKLWPEVDQIYVTIYFINDGGPFTLCFGPDDLKATERMLQKRFKEIKECEIPQKKVSWKCTKFCHQGKTTFEGTDIKPLTQKGLGHVTSPGETMSKCEQIDYALKHRSMESVVKNMSKPGHDVAHYHAPGSVDKKENKDE